MFFVLPSPTVAQTLDQQWTNCINTGGQNSIELEIGGCTAVIEAGQVTPARLALAFNHRGGAFHSQHDYERAIADYDQAIRLEPEDGRFRHSSCSARAQWGQQLDQALIDCDAAVRLGDKTALDSRGFLHLRRREFQAALTDYDAALMEYPNNPYMTYGRGVARVRLGQTAEGQADIAFARAQTADVASYYNPYGVEP